RACPLATGLPDPEGRRQLHEPLQLPVRYRAEARDPPPLPGDPRQLTAVPREPDEASVESRPEAGHRWRMAPRVADTTGNVSTLGLVPPVVPRFALPNTCQGRSSRVVGRS